MDPFFINLNTSQIRDKTDEESVSVQDAEVDSEASAGARLQTALRCSGLTGSRLDTVINDISLGPLPWWFYTDVYESVNEFNPVSCLAGPRSPWKSKPPAYIKAWQPPACPGDTVVLLDFLKVFFKSQGQKQIKDISTFLTLKCFIQMSS